MQRQPGGMAKLRYDMIVNQVVALYPVSVVSGSKVMEAVRPWRWRVPPAREGLRRETGFQEMIYYEPLCNGGPTSAAGGTGDQGAFKGTECNGDCSHGVGQECTCAF